MGFKEKIEEFKETLKNDKKKRIVFIITCALLFLCLVILPLFGDRENPEELQPTPVAEFSKSEDPVDRRTSYENDYLFQDKRDVPVFDSKDTIEKKRNSEKVFVSPPGYHNNNYDHRKQPTPEEAKPVPKMPEQEEKEEERRFPSDSFGNMGRKRNRSSNKNLWSAVVANGNRVVSSGADVRIRLGEDIVANGRVVKRNTVVTGTAEFNKNRMSVTVQNVRVENEWIPVNWIVHDEDGLEGIKISQDILDRIVQDGAEEGVDAGSGIESNVPIVGKVKVNLKQRVKEVSFPLENGHIIYLKEKE